MKVKMRQRGGVAPIAAALAGAAARVAPAVAAGAAGPAASASAAPPPNAWEPSSSAVTNVAEITTNALSHQAEKNNVSQKRYDNFIKFINAPMLIVIMKYVVFTAFLVFVFYMLISEGKGGGGGGGRRRRRDSCKYSQGECTGKIGSWLFYGGTGGSGGSPFDKFKTFDAHNYKMVKPRKSQTLGRCDNERYVEMSGPRSLKNKDDPRNICVDMQLTPNIEWNIDPARNNPEWNKIPPALRQLISKFNIIVIPFKIDDNVMHPDCSRAYYKADPKRRPVVFLEDNGATCKVKNVAPNEFFERMRHNDGELDDWSDIAFVDCKETGQCGRKVG